VKSPDKIFYEKIKNMIKKIIFYLSLIAILPLFTNCTGTSKASEEKSEAAKSFDKSEERGTVYLYRTG